MTMTSELDLNRSKKWALYPMGPELRNLLELAEVKEEHLQKKISEELKEEFISYVLEKIAKFKLISNDQLTILMEETLLMNLPEASFKLYQSFPEFHLSNSFKQNLIYGVSALKVGFAAQAEEALLQAKVLEPQEIASYINLIIIYIKEKRLDEAWELSLKGLAIAKNEAQLWELVCLQLEEKKLPLSQELAKLADFYDSWFGHWASLKEGTQDKQAEKTLAKLEILYKRGERALAFLTEYTGLLGEEGQFEKIPAIIWEAKTRNDHDLPWQLLMHYAQALLAMEKNKELKNLLDELAKRTDFPTWALDEFKKEKTIH